MEALLYFGKVIVTSGVMFLYYQLFLKDRTFHHYNRFYLLGILVLSVLLPLIRVSYFTLEVNSGIYLLLNSLSASNSNTDLSHDFFNSELFIYGAGLVSLFFLLKFTVAVIRIVQLRKQYPKQTFENISFYQTDIAEAPFSFFRNLFWKDTILIQSDLGRQILKHEIVHIEQKHSFDRVLGEVITAVFWFNPFFHLIKREISLIHEYLADHKTIQNSDTQAFAQMLLASRFSGKPLAATSPFLSSNLKKRLKMLKKSKTKYSYARKILALPLLFAVAFIYMVNAENREIEITNQEIDDYVYQMKSDTILPPPVPAAVPAEADAAMPAVAEVPEIPQDELKAMNKAAVKQHAEAQKISTALKKKSDELQKLAKRKDFESPKFKVLEKELTQLGEKLDAIYTTAEFKNLDQHYAKLDEYYSSDAFKATIKAAELAAAEADKKVNSPEFKRKIKEAEQRAEEAEKRINTPEFQLRIKDAELRAKEIQTKLDSPEFRLRLKDATQKAEEAARRSTETNLLRGKEQDVIYYLDGKSISKSEINKIKPENIESMNVYKKDGKGEIYIKSK